MGLADIAVMRERTLGLRLDEAAAAVGAALDELAAACLSEIERQGVRRGDASIARRAHLRYEGSDTALGVDHGANREMIRRVRSGPIANASASPRRKRGCWWKWSPPRRPAAPAPPATPPPRCPAVAGGEPATAVASIFTDGARREAVVAERGRMRRGTRIAGPAIIVEPHGTNVVEPGWSAELTEVGDLVLERVGERAAGRAVSASVDPIMLEIFNNLFMSIAEQMGHRAGEHGPFRQHQGAPRFLVRLVQRRRRAGGQRAAYAGPPRIHERGA